MHDIYLVLRGNTDSLPPLLSVIEELSRVARLTVVTEVRNNRRVEKYLESRGVEFLFLHNDLERTFSGGPVVRRLRDFYRTFIFRRFLRRCFEQSTRDFSVWCGSAETALVLSQMLPNGSYVVSMFELLDEKKRMLKSLSRILKNAHFVVVPEVCRAWILKAWCKLETFPVVIPNKPLEPSFNGPCEMKKELMSRGVDFSKRVVLYQGVFSSEERPLEPLCRAIKELDGFQLLLIGRKNDYSEQLIREFSQCVVYGGFYPAPTHLAIASCGIFAGVAVYSGNSLNTIFCAPNKIWEYAMYSLPMLISKNPSLQINFSCYKAGVFIDLDNTDSIKDALCEIKRNYRLYSKEASRFFSSVDVAERIRESIIGIQKVELESRRAIFSDIFSAIYSMLAHFNSMFCLFFKQR